MKLPSGREIDTDRLADVAKMLATESFAQENIDEAEETVKDSLVCEFFSLNGTEPQFTDDDVEAIMDVVRPVAEEIGGALAGTMDEYGPRIKDMIEKESERLIEEGQK